MASYQSTTLTIDSKGTQIYFTDTGAVRDSSNYITVVCIHGSLFTGGVFERILPLAAPNNLRLVVLNRRGYPGSTPYTAGEKDNLVHGRKLFLETLGLQVAQFLTAFLDQNDIPRASPDGKSGGLALLGWSLGGLSVLTLLGQSDAIPKSYFTRLGPYLRTCLLLDASQSSFGYQTPVSSAYSPYADPELKKEEIFDTFSNWVTQYFNHSDYKSVRGLDYGKGDMINPTYASVTPEERERVMDVTGVITDGVVLVGPIQVEVRKQTKLALFDEELARTLLPELRISHVACTKGVWQCLFSLIETERLFKEYTAEGKKGRPIRFGYVEKANHVPQWDKPQTVIDVILKEIRS